MTTAVYNQLLQQLQGMSASSNGTAIFFSGQQTINGKTIDNSALAQACQENTSNTYTIHNTAAGNFLDNTVTSNFNNDNLTESEFQNLWNIGSQMFAQEASGNVIAFVAGDLRPGSTFTNYELPTLLENNSRITGINGVDVAANENPLRNYAIAV